MALVTCYVDPDATGAADGTSWTDAYTSQNSADAALFNATSADLVSNTEWVECWCRCLSGSADTSLVIIDTNYTVNATYFIQISTPVDDRHDGKWDAGSYRISGSPANYYGVIRCNVNYTRIEGLQFDITSGSGTYRSGIFINCTNMRVLSNVIRDTGTNNKGLTIWNSDNHIIANNMIYDCGMNIVSTDNSFTDLIIYNNTLVDASVYNYREDGIDAGTLHFKNNLMQGGATDYSVAFNFGTINTATNISEDATSPDVAYRSIAVTFENEVSNDFHLDSAEDGSREGTDLSADGQYSFSDDIDYGDTRSDWDIGADEIIAAAGGLAMPPVFNQRKFHHLLVR